MPQVKGTDPGKGISGFGSTVVGAVTGPIGMITKIGIAGTDTDEIDVTTMNAPNRFKQFIAGLKDARDMTLDLLYHKTNAKTIQDAQGGANEAWTIELPDDSTFVVDGYIKTLGTQIPFNDKISQTATFRLSGPPVFTPGADPVSISAKTAERQREKREELAKKDPAAKDTPVRETSTAPVVAVKK